MSGPRAAQPLTSPYPGGSELTQGQPALGQAGGERKETGAMQGLELSCAETRTQRVVTAALTCASPGTSGPEPPGSGSSCQSQLLLQLVLSSVTSAHPPGPKASFPPQSIERPFCHRRLAALPAPQLAIRIRGTTLRGGAMLSPGQRNSHLIPTGNPGNRCSFSSPFRG